MAKAYPRIYPTPPNPRAQSRTKGLATIAKMGATARDDGRSMGDNPYRATDAYTAWREGWWSRDQELQRRAR